MSIQFTEAFLHSHAVPSDKDESGGEDGESGLFVWNGYVFLDRIGAGGQGNVYRVRSLRFDCIFAAKVFAHGNAADLQNVPELQAVQKLVHPGVIRCYDAFCDEGLIVVVYEYCLGGSLAQLIDEHPDGLPVPRAVEIMRQLVKALAYVHAQGMAHGDMKPDNVLFRNSERTVVAIADFGLASFLPSACIFAGTRPYTSPEMWIGTCDRWDTRASDVWALGVTFYVMLQGELPWTGATDEENVRQMTHCDFRLDVRDRSVVSVIGRMLVPQARRISCEELAKLPLFNPLPTLGLRSAESGPLEQQASTARTRNRPELLPYRPPVSPRARRTSIGGVGVSPRMPRQYLMRGAGGSCACLNEG